MAYPSAWITVRTSITLLTVCFVRVRRWSTLGLIGVALACTVNEEPGPQGGPVALDGGTSDDTDPAGEGFDANPATDGAINGAAEGELPLDGVDTDGDGNDYPILSGSIESPSQQTIPEASRCNGAALSLLAVESVNYCFGAFRLYVGNRGTTETGPGRLRVWGRENVHSEDLALPSLGPGVVWASELFRWGGSTEFALSHMADPGDCTPMDETGSFVVDAPSCP